MRFIKLLLISLIAIAALLVAVAWTLSPVEAVVWQPSRNPGLSGPFAPNRQLSSVTIVSPGDGFGPEDVTHGPDGYLYTGFDDGRIVRFTLDGPLDVFAATGGRPLGMQFDSSGNLIVADAVRGLLSVAPDASVQVLTDSVDGKKMRFVDDLDIAEDGTIWFSDVSTRFAYHNNIYDILEASATGRLLSYTPATGQTKIHLDGLYFANGVALGPGDEYVLVTETGASRIQRLWLQGSRAGQTDIFFDGLPGNPDNLSFNGEDIFWVALPAQRNAQFESLADKPFIRRLLGAVPPDKLSAGVGRFAMVVGLGIDGSVVHNLQLTDGDIYTITSVNEWGGQLYLGTVATASVGAYALHRVIEANVN